MRVSECVCVSKTANPVGGGAQRQLKRRGGGEEEEEEQERVVEIELSGTSRPSRDRGEGKGVTQPTDRQSQQAGVVRGSAVSRKRKQTTR